MQFKFNVNLTDDDYLEFNKFGMLKSHYGKKQLVRMRILLAVFACSIMLVLLSNDYFSLDSFIMCIPPLIVLVIFEIGFSRFFGFCLKRQIKHLKKSGKMGYSPEALIEFYDDRFVEITADSKTEQNYSSIERISIAQGKMIYIHLNNVMAFILPFSCFESKAQYDSFIAFIKTKNSNIDLYE